MVTQIGKALLQVKWYWIINLRTDTLVEQMLHHRISVARYAYYILMEDVPGLGRTKGGITSNSSTEVSNKRSLYLDALLRRAADHLSRNLSLTRRTAACSESSRLLIPTSL